MSTVVYVSNNNESDNEEDEEPITTNDNTSTTNEGIKYGAIIILPPQLYYPLSVLDVFGKLSRIKDAITVREESRALEGVLLIEARTETLAARTAESAEIAELLEIYSQVTKEALEDALELEPLPEMRESARAAVSEAKTTLRAAVAAAAQAVGAEGSVGTKEVYSLTEELASERTAQIRNAGKIKAAARATERANLAVMAASEALNL